MSKAQETAVPSILAKQATYLASAQMSQQAREALIAELREANESELKAVIIAERTESPKPKGLNNLNEIATAFKLTKEQKLEEHSVAFVDEHGKETVGTYSIKSAKKARKTALRDAKVREAIDQAVANSVVESYQVREQKATEKQAGGVRRNVRYFEETSPKLAPKKEATENK